MRKMLFVAAIWLTIPAAAQAFCGFYVARADGELYNEASKVVYVRDGQRTVITMSSDYRGEPSDFALIVPTPKVLEEDQIRTVKAEIVDHLDAYSAPRLVEYFDYDPCQREILEDFSVGNLRMSVDENERRKSAAAVGVQIKGEYAIGRYDVLILKANQSDGLVTFLTSEGYQLPHGAERVLDGYIRSGMKFFVARVNLDRHQAAETRDLPPLQISFNSRNFILPIQLGKLNADGPQDALIMMLTRNGRVEVVNYAETLLPTDTNVPEFVEGMFPKFYRSVFNKAVGDGGGIALEYGWDMGWCDPCAADPLSGEELQELGVDWLSGGSGAGQNVYVTRFHAQYTKDQMPEDLMFRETSNRENYQGRYVLNRPFTGRITCEYGRQYVKDTRLRLRREALNLAEITGWSPRSIEDRIRNSVPNRYW